MNIDFMTFFLMVASFGAGAMVGFLFVALCVVAKRGNKD